MRIVQDRKEITRLHLLGYTQQAIGEKLGKDQGNISRTLKRIRNELDKDAVNNMGEVRAVQNARLEGILKEYWEMYSSGKMDKPEAAVAGALKTVSEISKLLGVNINPAQIIDQKITTETVDPSLIAAKLASVFGDGDVVDAEIVPPAALEHDTGDADVEHPDELEELEEPATPTEQHDTPRPVVFGRKRLRPTPNREAEARAAKLAEKFS